MPPSPTLPCEPHPQPTGLAAVLTRVPPWVQTVFVLAAVAIGLIVGGVVGAILLLVALTILAGLLLLAWRVLTQPERLLRIAILVLLVALTLVRLVPGRA